MPSGARVPLTLLVGCSAHAASLHSACLHHLESQCGAQRFCTWSPGVGRSLLALGTLVQKCRVQELRTRQPVSKGNQHKGTGKKKNKVRLYYPAFIFISQELLMGFPSGKSLLCLLRGVGGRRSSFGNYCLLVLGGGVTPGGELNSPAILSYLCYSNPRATQFI